MIRTVIVGAGMTGLTLARLLRARGQEPIVLERGPAGAYQPRGFMALSRHKDADSACRSYLTWREPAVRPLEAMDPAWQRIGEIRNSADRPVAEAWPPVS